MAVVDPTSVQLVDEKLRQLLVKAKQLKPSNDIEPPLPASAFAGDDGLPQDDRISKAAQSTAVEIVSRRIFHTQAAGTSNLDVDFGDIWHLLDLLQILGDQDQCEPSILWYIVEELLDSRSIEGCRVIFDYLESRRERLVAKSFRKVNLVILRACNELLRRLSRAEDAVFCGRVFIFVFQSFPLGDKSSVNRHGDYNVDNVTTIDSANSFETLQTTQDVDMGDAQDRSADVDQKQETDLDLNDLHPKFWGLQKTFANPPSLFDTALLADFKAVFDSTLRKFNSVTKVSSVSSAKGKHGIKRKAGDLDPTDSTDNFNPKYLTSRELFELELSDLSFQRHVLVQAMILLEFLLSFTEKAKKKQHARTQQKYQFTLSEEDTEWVYQTKKAIVASLREGHDGPSFVRMVETVLSRDKNWVRWKEANCPEILLPAVDPSQYTQAAKSARSISAWRRLQTGGSLDLRFLSQSDIHNSMDAFAVQEHALTPQVEKLVIDVQNVELDLEMARSTEETESLQQLKASATWRTLRVASVNRLAKFDKLTSDASLDVLLDKPEAEKEADGAEEQTEDNGSAMADVDNTKVVGQSHDRGIAGQNAMSAIPTGIIPSDGNT